jgi:hypothetical protein
MRPLLENQTKKKVPIVPWEWAATCPTINVRSVRAKGMPSSDTHQDNPFFFAMSNAQPSVPLMSRTITALRKVLPPQVSHLQGLACSAVCHELPFSVTRTIHSEERTSCAQMSSHTHACIYHRIRTSQRSSEQAFVFIEFEDYLGICSKMVILISGICIFSSHVFFFVALFC